MKSNLKKYLGEGLLIVFSVLFALFINKAFEDYKTNQKVTIAKESITKELYRNQAIINRWKEKHITIENRISGMIENKEDSLNVELKKYNFFNLMVLTNNKSLIDELLINTAWQSAKTTGIISEFDYETIQELTSVYNIQEFQTDKTLMKIINYLNDTETHNLDNLDKTLVQFELKFHELTGQEEMMSVLYKRTIEELEK